MTNQPSESPTVDIKHEQTTPEPYEPWTAVQSQKLLQLSKTYRNHHGRISWRHIFASDPFLARKGYVACRRHLWHLERLADQKELWRLRARVTRLEAAKSGRQLSEMGAQNTIEISDDNDDNDERTQSTNQEEPVEVTYSNSTIRDNPPESTPENPTPVDKSVPIVSLKHPPQNVVTELLVSEYVRSSRLIVRKEKHLARLEQEMRGQLQQPNGSIDSMQQSIQRVCAQRESKVQQRNALVSRLLKHLAQQDPVFQMELQAADAATTNGFVQEQLHGECERIQQQIEAAEARILHEKSNGQQVWKDQREITAMMQQLRQMEAAITQEEETIDAAKQKRLQLFKQLVHVSKEIATKAMAKATATSAESTSET